MIGEVTMSEKSDKLRAMLAKENWQVIRLRQNPLHGLRQNCEVDNAAKMEPEF